MEPLANFNLEQKSSLSDKSNSRASGDEARIIICTRTLVPPIINVSPSMFALSKIFLTLISDIQNIYMDSQQH
jgi:hypothetical protein